MNIGWTLFVLWAGVVNGATTTVPTQVPYQTEDQCVFAMMDAQRISDSSREMRIRNMICVRNDHVRSRQGSR